MAEIAIGDDGSTGVVHLATRGARRPDEKRAEYVAIANALKVLCGQDWTIYMSKFKFNLRFPL